MAQDLLSVFADTTRPLFCNISVMEIETLTSATMFTVAALAKSANGRLQLSSSSLS